MPPLCGIPNDSPAATVESSEKPSVRDSRAIVGWCLCVLTVAVLATVDVLVAAMIGGLIGAVYCAIRWRGPGRLRNLSVGVTAAVAVAGLIAAVALPVYAQRTAPLIMNVTPEQSLPSPSPIVSQVVLPLVGPLCDLFLLYLLLVQNIGEAGAILLLAAGADVILCAIVVLANREPVRMLLYVPLLRLLWRPLQLYAIGASTGRWLSGRNDTWRTVTRYGSVEVTPTRRQPAPSN